MHQFLRDELKKSVFPNHEVHISLLWMNTPIETCYMLTPPSQALKAHDAWMEDVSQSLQEVYPAGLGLL